MGKRAGTSGNFVLKLLFYIQEASLPFFVEFDKEEEDETLRDQRKKKKNELELAVSMAISSKAWMSEE